MPSLAERVEDIPDLTRHFIRRATGRDAPIEPLAIALLVERSWPGNVRELKQVVEVATAFAGSVVTRAAVESALAHRAVEPIDAAGAVDDLLERRELIDALSAAAGDVDGAAASLGIHRATMYRRMKRHGVVTPRLTPKVAPSRATVRHAGATGATPAML